jgi:hypothetical protein
VVAIRHMETFHAAVTRAVPGGHEPQFSAPGKVRC